MFDVASKSAGAQIVLATSCDDRYPPENIIDGSDETFWPTTGLFPQEFVLTFSSMMDVKRINLTCYNVKRIIFEKSQAPEPLKFESLTERVLEKTDRTLQREEFSVPGGTQMLHLRVLIESGHDHFVSVHKLSVDGNALHG
ncbi:hypothetical protein ACJMK2_041567 [Sinanodonta woodiana]|uniref:Intraflagellar transport protein 25 homolog n=1 Tax=Sinanodonta woodiana TaxID=1069815 RepID=A0ABD3W7J2_SINWO